jgi:lysozyme
LTDATSHPAPDDLEGSNLRPDPPDEGGGEGAAAPADEAARAAPGRLSRQGADFIARFEGCVLHLYNDPAQNATIGVGHLVHAGPIRGDEPAELRNGITRDAALALLQQDAADAAAAVARQIKVPLEQHQLDALISFVFNVGEGSLQASTLRRRLNAREYTAVPAELDRWVFASGKRLPGLVRRRKAEGLLFAQGSYE